MLKVKKNRKGDLNNEPGALLFLLEYYKINRIPFILRKQGKLRKTLQK
jgi:hypothetical protein